MPTLVPTTEELQGLTREGAVRHLLALREMYNIVRMDGPDRNPEDWDDFKEAYNDAVRTLRAGEVPDPEEIRGLYQILVEVVL